MMQMVTHLVSRREGTGLGKKFTVDSISGSSISLDESLVELFDRIFHLLPNTSKLQTIIDPPFMKLERTSITYFVWEFKVE